MELDKEEKEMRPYLSVVIPAYNEEFRIGKTLESVYAYLTVQPFTWELLIVLDGVTDNTLDVVQTFAKGKNNIRWIDRRENRGKGYTIREGLLSAKGEIRLFTDADNSTDMSHFDKMKPFFKSGASVVICSRDAKDAEGASQVIPQPFLKRFLGNVGNLFIQLVAVPGIWDTQCGFKAFRSTAAEKIFSISRVERWGFDMEALALARRFGYKIEVVGANWVDEPNTHVTKLDYIRSMMDALKVRWHLMTGGYNFNTAELSDPKPTPVEDR